MFKIGDVVVINEYGHAYSITRPGAICTITDITQYGVHVRVDDISNANLDKSSIECWKEYKEESYNIRISAISKAFSDRGNPLCLKL